MNQESTVAAVQQTVMKPPEASPSTATSAVVL